MKLKLVFVQIAGLRQTILNTHWAKVVGFSVRINTDILKPFDATFPYFKTFRNQSLQLCLFYIQLISIKVVLPKAQSVHYERKG